MKRILLIVFSVFIIFSMAGCDSKEASAKKKELNVYYPSFASTIATENLDVLIQAKKKFEENNKNITVKLNPRGGYVDSFYIKNDVEAGSKIDVLLMYDYNISSFLGSNALLTLDDFTDQDTNLMDETYDAGLLDRVKIDGTLYTLPVGFFAQGLLYNKELLNKYQVEPKADWTWKDFFNAANTISKGDCAFNNTYLGKGSLMELFLNSRGLRVVNSASGTTNVNNPLILEWYQYERKMWTADGVSFYNDPNAPDLKTGYRPIESLNKGEYALLPSTVSITDYGFIKNNYPNIEIINMPLESEDGFNRGNAYSAGIYKKSSMQKEAYEFMKLLISEDLQKALEGGLGINPVNKKVMAESMKKLPGDKAVIYKNIINKCFLYYDSGAGVNAIYGIIQPYFTNKISSDEDVTEANLNELAEQVEASFNGKSGQ